MPDETRDAFREAWALLQSEASALEAQANSDAYPDSPRVRRKRERAVGLRAASRLLESCRVRLDFILTDACIAAVEDGDQLGLFIQDGEDVPAFTILTDITGDDGEVTEGDAPWLTHEQRANLSGTAANASGFVSDKAAILAAIDHAARRARRRSQTIHLPAKGRDE